MIKKSRTILITALLLVAAAGTTEAQLVPLGSELTISESAAYPAQRPDTAMDEEGSFLVVWTSTVDNSQEIAARRFDSAGTPLSSDLRINTFLTGMQNEPALDALPGGGFLVVWQSDGSGGDDTDSSSIQARRFSSDGDPLGDQFQVNSFTTGTQSFPAVATDTAGQSLIAWQSSRSPADDFSSFSILARRLSPGGSLVGEDFQVNSFTTDAQLRPDLAATGIGRWTTTWESLGSAGSDQGSSSVQMRRIGEIPLGEDLQVNVYTTSLQERPSIAAAPSGEFVIAWQSLEEDGDLFGVFARRFSSSGDPLDTPFQADSTTAGAQENPDAAMDADGDLVIVWESTSPDLLSVRDVRARRYASDGSSGDPFQINTFTSLEQIAPAGAFSAQGNFIAVWESAISPEGGGRSILGARFQESVHALFADGFESEDLLAWSGSEP